MTASAVGPRGTDQPEHWVGPADPGSAVVDGGAADRGEPVRDADGERTVTTRPGGRDGAAVTARGLGLVGAGVLLLVGGFRFGYPDLAVLGVAAVSALVCGAVFAAWRPRLAVRRVAEPDRVARGDAARMTLTVRNTSRLRAANLVASDRCGALRVPVPLLRLRAGADTTVGYPVPTSRRGVVPIGPLRVVRGDPLGLMRLTRSHGATATVWVHPRIHPLAAVPAGAARSLDGRIDGVPHGTITFDALREYVVGDELRRVHWRTSAKVGELMVREDVDTSLPSLVVVLDDRASAHPGARDGYADSFEAACEAAASVIAAAVREDLPVRLRLVCGESAGPHLDVLTQAGLSEGADWLHPVLRQLRQQRDGDTLIFLTGPGGRAGLGAVGALRGSYSAVVLGVLGAAGAGPGATDPDARSGAMDAGVVAIDAVDGADFAAAWDGVRGW